MNDDSTRTTENDAADDRTHEVLAADDTGMVAQHVILVEEDVERELEPEGALERESL